ncbi:DC-STAMP domain-containing protein 2-like [Amyelois transitella]|uniref:DC-STAMP domain-containing protein 2-like n=1 Tax=Amyelois transitella TaxID=680683 RepID=UPI00298FBD26|nr:DC-STAMP domain-containing protein 2-like [Amyelois transitella]
MAHFALLWKARTIEKYRQNYENQKYISVQKTNTPMPQKSLSQRLRCYRQDTQKRFSKIFQKLYPEGSSLSNFFLYLRTDQACLYFVLKSLLGFLTGLGLTYLCFLFLVFQLSISLFHATIVSSIIGVLLTMSLAFSYRIRCLVFLLLPQFFSRAGRYTLTCYALVLILTGPATNTLKNSEVLTESMACRQEEIKSLVYEVKQTMRKPLNSMRETIKIMVQKLHLFTRNLKITLLKVNRLSLSVLETIQSTFSWLQWLSEVCNRKMGSPYERCIKSFGDRTFHYKGKYKPNNEKAKRQPIKAEEICSNVKKYKATCFFTDFVNGSFVASIKRRLKEFSQRIREMLYLQIHVHHSYSFPSNTSHSASQVAAGIVTEIRKRADPLLTWLSWSSCVTSLFLLLIIFRAKYYQHMFETRSRFDNKYITKEIRDLDLNRLRHGRETILPLNKRERSKYVSTTSFRLAASEKIHLNRSIVFMTITTFKLLIHMVADYSLYWVLMTIQYHGKNQSPLPYGVPNAGMHISGKGRVADMFRDLLMALTTPLEISHPLPTNCLPDPKPPDLQRYTQIGILIFLLWFFSLFEPYGLRLRHVVMGLYRPERAKARAEWLYNHILRTRGGFMKFARRKLHRTYKCYSEERYTFKRWLSDHIPCDTPNCPGTYCSNCFSDLGELCTICISPSDYGDLSDVSLEK